VPLAEIEKHGFNLNIPRYIDSSEPEDLQDIDAHLRGGIPTRDVDALGEFWQVLPAVRDTLFGPGDRPGYLAPLVDATGVKSAILDHAEFTAFTGRVTTVFDAWRAAHEGGLRSITIGDKPKDLIAAISEDLLDRFKPVPLIDGYDVFQHLMTYWAEVMQDDTYILVQDGWAAGRVIRELVKNADGKFSETPDITLGRRKLKAELIPPVLIVARFFAAQQAALQALEAKAEEAARVVEELDEEHGGEDGLLAEAKTDKGKLTAKSVKDRARDVRADKDAGEERAMLKACAAAIEVAADADAAVKAAQLALDTAVVAQYAKLTEDQVKALLVEDKWLAQVRGDVAAEVDRVSQALAGRVKVLAERYATPLPKLAGDLEVLSARVAAHLGRMGFAL
jgi:type I restriction enzyme M protein